MGDHAVGKDCKLYYNSATNASPTWVLINGAIDVNVPMTKGEADVSSRLSTWRMKGAGLKEGAIEFGYLHQKVTDTVFDALLASYVSDTKRQFAAVDMTIATQGAQGLKSFMHVMEMTQDQSLEGGVMYNFVLAPTRHEESSAVVEPSWHDTP